MNRRCDGKRFGFRLRHEGEVRQAKNYAAHNSRRRPSNDSHLKMCHCKGYGSHRELQDDRHPETPCKQYRHVLKEQGFERRTKHDHHHEKGDHSVTQEVDSLRLMDVKLCQTVLNGRGQRKTDDRKQDYIEVFTPVSNRSRVGNEPLEGRVRAEVVHVVCRCGREAW